MSKPAEMAAVHHLGFFMMRIRDFMENVTGVHFDNPDIEAKLVPDIVKSLSERVEIDLSDFPTIASESVLASDLAKSLHDHYLGKIQKHDAIGPPITPP
jgi:hypothetical protein